MAERGNQRGIITVSKCEEVSSQNDERKKGKRRDGRSPSVD